MALYVGLILQLFFPKSSFEHDEEFKCLSYINFKHK